MKLEETQGAISQQISSRHMSTQALELATEDRRLLMPKSSVSEVRRDRSQHEDDVHRRDRQAVAVMHIRLVEEEE